MSQYRISLKIPAWLAEFILRSILTGLRTLKTFSEKCMWTVFAIQGEGFQQTISPFDQACQEHRIEHRFIMPRYPETNGIMERFNDRVSHIINTICFKHSADLEQTLLTYVLTYNMLLPQRTLSGRIPLETVKNCYKIHPEYFCSDPANFPEPDTAGSSKG